MWDINIEVIGSMKQYWENKVSLEEKSHHNSHESFINQEFGMW
jgi:hypothetical protein